MWTWYVWKTEACVYPEHRYGEGEKCEMRERNPASVEERVFFSICGGHKSDRFEWTAVKEYFSIQFLLLKVSVA